MPIMPASISETTTITENGSHNVAKYTTANVSVDPVVESLNVTPTTSAQSLTPTTGVDGFNEVNVSAVTSSIDSNIQTGNIKSGVSILGVNGSVVELNGETREVTPTTSQQTITPSSGKNGITSVTVNAVTSSIDANITASNIKKNVSILGVTGSYEGSGSTPDYYLTLQNTNGTLTRAPIFPDLTGVTTLGWKVFYQYFANATNKNSLSGAIDMSSIISMSGASCCDEMFEGCTGITSVDLSSLVKLENCNRMFKGCTNLTSVDFSSLTTFGAYINFPFTNNNNLVTLDLSKVETVDLSNMSNDTPHLYIASNCSRLTTLDLSSLRELKGNPNHNYTGFMIQLASNCPSLTTVKLDSLEYMSDPAWSSALLTSCGIVRQDFPSLYKINSGVLNCAFVNCTNLRSIYFYALTDFSEAIAEQGEDYTFYCMLDSCSNVTVHFPKASQSTIENWQDVVSGFGGTNTTVLFDLVTAITGSDSNTYTRKQKNSTSTATAWIYNDTLYYTSGTNEPQVGDDLYSDAACTTVVTTIDSIA